MFSGVNLLNLEYLILISPSFLGRFTILRVGPHSGFCQPREWMLVFMESSGSQSNVLAVVELFSRCNQMYQCFITVVPTRLVTRRISTDTHQFSMTDRVSKATKPCVFFPWVHLFISQHITVHHLP